MEALDSLDAAIGEQRPPATGEGGLPKHVGLLSVIEQGALLLEPNGRCVFANEPAASLLGIPARELVGMDAVRLLGRMDDPDWPRELRMLLAGEAHGGPVTVAPGDRRARLHRVDGGLLLIIERPPEVPPLMAATRALCRSFDWDDMVRDLASAVLGDLADWSLVDVVEPSGARRRVGATADATKREICDRLAQLGLGGRSLVADVVRQGRPLLIEHVTDDLIRERTIGAEQAELVRALGARSVIVVPGAAQGRVLAALTLVRGEGRPSYSPADLALAEEIATRAAQALTHARAYAREREARRALARSEARFRALVGSSAQVVWTAAADGKVCEDSPSWRAFTGQTYEQFRGMGWLDAIHPDDRPRVHQVWARSLEHPTTNELEYRLCRPDGSYSWTIVRSTPVFDEQGNMREWVGTNTDIQDRKQVALALEESETRLRLAVEAAQIGTWDYDPRGGRLIWSEREKALFGLPANAEVDSATFLRGIHPEDRERAADRVAWAMDPASGGDYRDELRVVGIGDGVERWLSVQGRCFFDGQGRPTRFVGVDLDVTEKRLATQRLGLMAEASRILMPSPGRASLEQTLVAVARSVAEFLGDACALFLLEPDGGSLVNVALETRSPVLSARLTPLAGSVWPADRGVQARALRERRPLLIPVFDAGTRDEFLYTEPLRQVFAGIPVASLIAVPIVAADQVLGLIGCFRERGRAYGQSDLLLLQELADRCALAVSEARSFRRAETARQQIQSLIDAVPFLIAYVDRQGRYGYVGRGYETWFGLPQSHYVGKSVREVVGDEAYDRIRPRVEGALRGEPQDFETVVPYVRGGTRTVHALYLPQVDEKGASNGFVAVVIDVSEHKALVESLLRTLRFSDEFIGILGHDLRAPLSAISTATEIMLMKEDEARAMPLLRIRRSASRMARMIDQVLDFTRARIGGGIPIARTPTNLHAIAQQIIDELQGVAAQEIALESSGDTDGFWDGDRIGQLVQNLVGNALEHGDPAEPVRVRLRGDHPGQVILDVQNGGVIPAAGLPLLFDPFQGAAVGTGKRSRGLGLGLYIVKQIALAHGGTVQVFSSAEQGTRFEVLLPRGGPESPEGVVSMSEENAGPFGM